MLARLQGMAAGAMLPGGSQTSSAMPKASSESAIARQWEILKLLPSEPPGHTVAAIRGRLLADSAVEVTKRTVERDLVDLSRVLPICCNDKSKPFGWHWLPNTKVEFPGMTFSEAFSLGLVEDILRALAPPRLLGILERRFQMAQSKLRALHGNRSARWRDLVRYVPPGLAFLPPVIDKRVSGAIYQALLDRRRIVIQYARFGSDETKFHTVDPIAFIQQGARPYLLAASAHEHPALYALQRITRAEVTEQVSKPPDGFSLDAFLANGGMEFGAENNIRLKARINEELVRILAETPLSADQRIARGGDVHVLSATLPDSWHLHFWILSQGSRITVTSPAHLKRRISDDLEAAAANYR